ncbi:MAG: acetyl-CoA carboxylase biotin carboxylase subunit [Bdellovibrionota bacterium]
MTQKIQKLLIANRGEIALRIQRACNSLSIIPVTIASEADRGSLAARMADELVVIGPPAPAESYLNIEKIISTAKESGCQAVHPGYGFLSENAEFAQAVEDAGLIFVGPSPESIRVLGSKTEARKSVTAYGVPCTPGAVSGLSDAELISEADKIGYPVIIKAVSGGGGRGMRVAKSKEEMKDFLPRTRAEAKKFFSNQDVYLEKFIVNPRHVEVQIFGDSHGNLVHFGTRDCSAQRRHQKLIEEAPAPNLSDKLREAIHQAAVDAAKSVNYKNAGTAEFLVSGETFYFLEMNTRIQVEHPVTEEVTGVDLVKLQLEVAQGAKLPFKQSEIKFSGHAIEFRLYAESPAKKFMPAIGKIESLERPQAKYIREDYALEAGDEITPYYDAMISKLIVTGKTRLESIENSKVALRNYKVTGVDTTIPFHRWMLTTPEFINGGFDIGYVEREFSPERIKELEALDIKDPAHISEPGGCEHVEQLRYFSPAFNAHYLIELIHREDGIFVAVPKSQDGKVAPPKHRRASNGRKTVLSALTEVLSSIPPEEVFNKE